MGRRLSSLLLVALLCLAGAAETLIAATVAPDVARQIAVREAARLDRTALVEAELEILGDARGGILAYLIELAPTGYVVVAGEDGLPPVLAYSAHSAAPRVPGGDPLRALVCADLSARLAAGQAKSRHPAWDLAAAATADPQRFQQWPPAGSTATEGWVEIRWNQGHPYNQYCPRDLAHGGGRSVAGCPAVAMGQILDYLRTGAAVRFDDADDYQHGYGGNYFRFDDDWATYGFPSWPQLNTYLEALAARWDAGLPTDAAGAAALVFACGVAAHQVYSASGSGTFSVDQAFMAYRRFGFADCELIAPEDPALLDRLAADMQAARPAHLAVVTPDWQAGHNVVVDGYNTDEYFHVNFGWGGAYDGWYLLPSGLPYNLTVFEGVIVDIVPPVVAVPAMATRLSARAWPNPCNPRAVVEFTTAQAGRIDVCLHDARGRRVRTLLAAERPVGTWTVVWDGCDDDGRAVATGNYLYRVAAAGGAATGKLVLLR